MANQNLVHKLVKATLDPSGVAGHRSVAAHGLGVFIPQKAVITRAWYDVVTTFTSAGDDATIALSCLAANDLKTAITIKAAGDVWDAGIHGCLPGAYAEATVAGDTAVLDAARIAGSMIKLSTAAKELVATVGVEVLVLGKLNLYVEYVVSE